MAEKTHINRPDYKKIYIDLIEKKFPHKKLNCEKLLEKDELSAWDIIKLNEILFGKRKPKVNEKENSLRAFQSDDILEILLYQKKNCLNNTELANHFKLSKNTVSKWNKLFNVN